MRLHERAGITHSDDDDVLPLGRDEAPVPVALQLTVLGHEQPLLVLGQELHREVHALELRQDGAGWTQRDIVCTCTVPTKATQNNR